MAEARAVKFSTKVDFIKSCQMDEKSPLRGAWLRSYACTTVDLKNFATPYC